MDQFGNLFGTLYHPKGVISKFLVTEGYAKVDRHSSLERSTAAIGPICVRWLPGALSVCQ